MTLYNMILDTMKNAEKNGNVYIPVDELFARCSENRQNLSQTEFSDALAQLIRDGLLNQEEDRLYFTKTKNHEDAAATAPADLLSDNQLPHIQLPDKLVLGDTVLVDEQRRAVSLALEHRLSIIQGGAGSGKTTLVKAIIQ